MNCSSHDARGYFRASTCAQVPSPSPHHSLTTSSAGTPLQARHRHTQNHPLWHCSGQLGLYRPGSTHSASPRLLAVDSTPRRTLADASARARATAIAAHCPPQATASASTGACPMHGRQALCSADSTAALPHSRCSCAAAHTRLHTHAAAAPHCCARPPGFHAGQCTHRRASKTCYTMSSTERSGAWHDPGRPARGRGAAVAAVGVAVVLPGWAYPHTTTSAPTGGSQSRC